MTHIVDTLIEERAIRLMRHAALWEVLKRGLYPLLLYDTARRMADVVAPMSAEQTFDYLLETLAMDVAVTGLDNIPREGLVFVTPNHPAGIAVRRHLAGSNRMEDSGGDIAGPFQDLFIGFHRARWHQQLLDIGLEAGAIGDAQVQPGARHRHLAVQFRRQIVGLDRGRRQRIGRGQPQPAAAFRAELADRAGEG